MNKLGKIRKIVGDTSNINPDQLVGLDGHRSSSRLIAEIRKVLGKPKLFAIVHDGTFDGDNTFWCPGDRVEYKEGQTIRDIRKAFQAKRFKEDQVCDDETWTPEQLRELSDSAREVADLIEGAWVVDEDTFKAIDWALELATGNGCGNDSASYMLNRAAKSMADALAIKRLGKKPR